MMPLIDVLWNESEPSKRAQLLNALKDAGFSVRAVAKEAISPSRPCLVIWSRADIAEAFARLPDLEKAARGKHLVSVLLERTPLPSSISPHPVVDLVSWRGASDNASFVHLVRTLKQIAAECEPEGVGGKISVRMRRVLGGITVLAVLGFLFSSAMSVVAVQNSVCSISFSQPLISDTCGFFGLGGKPTREERLAWEARPAGSCEALRAHIRRFDTGAFRSTAADMLAAARVVSDETWVQDHQRLPLFTSIGEVFDGQSSAEADARQRAERRSADLCGDLTAPNWYRNPTSVLSDVLFDCDVTASGIACGLEGVATCAFERAVRTERAICEAEQ